MIYQDPLAYLLGLEGIALLDAWAGDHDREFSWPSTSATGNLAWHWTPPAGPAASPSSLPGADIRLSASTVHRACSPTRRRVPDGEFHVAALDQLPLPDGSVDAIICALALVHVHRLQPVLAE